MKTMKVDKLNVEIYPTRRQMGEAAARDIKECFCRLLANKDSINVIFAAAPSQNEVLDALCNDTDIEWGRINAYHMDEYIGLSKDAPQGFGNFLANALFGRVGFKSVKYIDPEAKDIEAEAERYSKLLLQNPADVVVMGIGENGHIAFNDPPVADFKDPRVVKPVELDAVCRQQQVNDGCFATLGDVPTHALTLTVPTLMRAPEVFCIVPAATKAWAVERTLNGEVGEACPATALRSHSCAKLYLDGDSSSKL